MTKFFLAGHLGMVGSAIYRQLKKEKNAQVIKANKLQLDLTNQNAVFNFFKKEQPDEVILSAAKVGGIFANNSYPAEFIYENLQIQNNIIHAAHLHDVNKLLFLGSSCIYPKKSKQPITEDALLSGKLETTNEPYAVAKIAGIKMCESYNRQYNRDYRAVMPTNLYGPGDNYHPENSHVVPALIKRFHEAKIDKKPNVAVWGNGFAKREFLYVDDMAKASIFVHKLDKEVYQKHTSINISHINIGTGKDISIRELAYIIRQVVGFKGSITFDKSKLEGTKRKLLNIELISDLGWKATTSLYDGLNDTYKYFLKYNQ